MLFYSVERILAHTSKSLHKKRRNVFNLLFLQGAKMARQSRKYTWDSVMFYALEVDISLLESCLACYFICCAVH